MSYTNPINTPTSHAGHGWTETDPYEVVSQHRVAAGTLVYARGVDGALQIRLRPHFGPERVLNDRGPDRTTQAA